MNNRFPERLALLFAVAALPALHAAPRALSPPAHFEQNVGQSAQWADFLVRGTAYRVALEAGGPSLALPFGADRKLLRLELVDADPAAQPQGLDRLSASVHYIRNTRHSAPLFDQVRYSNVYEGVSVLYRLVEGKLEYDFIVEPGADPDAVRLRFHGADRIEIGDDGSLTIHIGDRAVHQPAPVIFQDGPQGRSLVNGAHVQADNGDIAFLIGDYDRSLPLVIDPILDYSTYLGAGDEDAAHGIAVDDEGSVYVVGSTRSSDFPTTSGSFMPEFGGDDSDAFVSKFNADGELVFSTFFGSESSDEASDVAIGQDGSIYITGWTESEDLPVSGFQTEYGGSRDCFVAKFSADGAELLHSSYLGHGDEDACNAIAVNDDDEIFVAGYTSSTDFPSTAGAFQEDQAGERDAFVAKISADGLELELATLLGGVADDTAYDLAIDSAGRLVVVGSTDSSGFPVTDDARENFARGMDGFVAILSADGSALEYGSYIGGQNDELALGVAIGPNDEIYVVGESDSTDFELSANPAQSALNGDDADMFVAVFSSTGADLLYGTYFGGNGRDFANDVAVDAAGRIHIVGGSESDDFPVTDDPLLGEHRGDRDGVLVQLERNGLRLLHATYFGGENDDEIVAIAAGTSGGVYLAGWTRSNNLPVSENAFQDTFTDDNIPVLDPPAEAFVTYLSPAGAEAPFTVVSAASFSFATLAGGSIVSGFGSNLAEEEIAATEIPLPTELGGIQVIVTDESELETPASLLMVSPEQINFVLPDIAGPESLIVTVLRDGEAIASGSAPADLVAPSLFTADFSGAGVAAAYVVQLVDGEQTSALVFDPDTLAAVPIDLEGAQTALELYGTGVRNGVAVTATANGEDVEVLYSGDAPGFVGLDQVNVLLPEELAGAGEVTIVITADEVESNPVTVTVH